MGKKNHKLVMQLTFLPAEFFTSVLSILECIDPEEEFSFSERFDFYNCNDHHVKKEWSLKRRVVLYKGFFSSAMSTTMVEYRC